MVQLRFEYVENTLVKRKIEIQKQISKLLESTDYCWLSEDDGTITRYYMNELKDAIEDNEIDNKEIIYLVEKHQELDDEIDRCRSSEEGYDVVDENGNYLMHASSTFPADSDAILRPNDTVHHVYGKTIVVSYFHNGGVCDVYERED